MLREKWEFRFAALLLADAAAKKKKHHQSRLRFWQGAQDKVMAEVRDSGIEVSVSEAGASYSNRSTGYGPQVMVRNDLQRRLTECHGKIGKHAQKVAEYHGWVQVLKGNSNERLSLNADDYLYFFHDEPEQAEAD